MTYIETLQWMFEQLPMYQRQGKTAFKKDLTNTIALAQQLGHPEQQFKSIHVAGTNGKGSVSHMLASILQSSGYKVGLYTSPHLKDFRERIKINGEQIQKEKVVEFISTHKEFLERNRLSFFEMTVGMAFDYFSKEQVDIAVIEVGLGGRLDSTNIITPLLSVITNIGLDHTEFLGHTLELIAGEKSGIIKPEIPVVIGETLEETKPVFIQKATQNNAPIHFAEDLECKLPACDLKGSYQQFNIRTCLKSIEVLNTLNCWDISQQNIEKGLKSVVSSTQLRGRWEVLGQMPKIITDTAHNAEGLTLVLNQLTNESFENLHMVLGFVNDKDLNSILQLFPQNAKYYFSKPDVPRGLPAKDLHQQAKQQGLKGDVFLTVQDAFKAARQEASENDLIYIGGSTFTVAEIL
ncbi:bifunctional folylpolyglutamate synthase/dihydrofolate synthase [Psychroflexus tropicus]|uniref:bifunctional folylpolyglutamate synthase/dihydrofolate synthase n=1 Tax=Psychroflexus tropicus TaxID=197345 RepID=UPI00037665C9|nr:folylpolyglutamate synthase/dihydrofolate synthase family protein [Psychroflexus tropicus]